LIFDLVPLTDKAFFMFFTHVLIQLFIAKERLATELAVWMYSTLYGFFGRDISIAALQWWKMERKQTGRVQGVFVRKDLLESYAYVAKVGRLSDD
jgi:hypothetical protein